MHHAAPRTSPEASKARERWGAPQRAPHKRCGAHPKAQPHTKFVSSPSRGHPGDPAAFVLQGQGAHSTKAGGPQPHVGPDGVTPGCSSLCSSAAPRVSGLPGPPREVSPLSPGVSSSPLGVGSRNTLILGVLEKSNRAKRSTAGGSAPRWGPRRLGPRSLPSNLFPRSVLAHPVPPHPGVCKNKKPSPPPPLPTLKILGGTEGRPLPRKVSIRPPTFPPHRRVHPLQLPPRGFSTSWGGSPGVGVGGLRGSEAGALRAAAAVVAGAAAGASRAAGGAASPAAAAAGAVAVVAAAPAAAVRVGAQRAGGRGAGAVVGDGTLASAAEGKGKPSQGLAEGWGRGGRGAQAQAPAPRIPRLGDVRIRPPLGPFLLPGSPPPGC